MCVILLDMTTPPWCRVKVVVYYYYHQNADINNEVGGVVVERRRAFEEWLQRSDRVTNDRYRAQRVVVKRAVQVLKRTADWRWRERLGNDFDGNSKDILESGKASEER